MKALDGVKIIDFTQGYDGGFCTMQLADFGARVIKIENSESGDEARKYQPLNNDHSGYFASINRNKESISVDIFSSEGREIIKKLVRDADIVVENFKVGTLEKLGLGYEELKKINSKLIFASISGFGQTGPLKELEGHDNIIQSMSGIMEMTGFPKGTPTKVGPKISKSLAGLNTSLGILMAYFHKLNTGEGQKIDVSMMDTMFSILESPIIFNTLLGEEVTRAGNNDAGTLVPYDVYPCKDGYFSAGLAGEKGWDKFCTAIEIPELIEDPRFVTNSLRCKNYEIVTPIMTKFFLTKTRKELGEIFNSYNIPNAPVLSVSEVMEVEQLKSRDMIQDIEDKGIGKYLAIGNPMKMDKTPAKIEKGAPLLGQETKEILEELGYSKEEVLNLVEKRIV